MSTIIIKHIIQEEKITISFDSQEGSLCFPEVYLDITTDIDFNDLLIKLTDFIELNKIIKHEFVDDAKLLNISLKIKLIKETLEEIYKSYNEQMNMVNSIV
jgi:hypothetical protein